MSILNIGLILTHERIKFPFVRKDKIDFEMGSIVDQLRCCFTFLDSRELPEHSAMFGAFSLEFDVESLRELGAFPVIYIPQPIRDGKAGFREVSIVGNQLVHQLRDVAVLLEELLQLQATVDDNPDLGESEIQVRTTRKLGATKLSSVELIVDHLLGEKVSFLKSFGICSLHNQSILSRQLYTPRNVKHRKRSSILSPARMENCLWANERERCGGNSLSAEIRFVL